MYFNLYIPFQRRQKSALVELQEVVLQEQLNLIGAQDLLLKQQHELTIQQQTERHERELELLKAKQEISKLKMHILQQKINEDL